MDAGRIVRIVALALCYIVLIVVLIIGILGTNVPSPALPLFAIAGMVVLTLVVLQVEGNSDRTMARQSNRTLDLASKTLEHMQKGLNAESAQGVCELMLPAVLANAVSITDNEKVLGFAGVDQEHHPANSAILTAAMLETLQDGQTRVVDTAEAIGFPDDFDKLRAGIIVPLVVSDHIVGSLTFYYTSPRLLSETQKAMAEGFAQLLATQLSLSLLQQQTELAAQMELRALQAQINPHFLFNTINTIAAITRTDPSKARVMLREFAVYYRRLLENSEDLIPLSKEIEQTERYLMFQKARFGEDAIELSIEVEPGLENLPVPSFVMQPIVENAVGHGRREEGTLHIDVKVHHVAESVIISIADDGVGIPREQLANLVEGGSKTGMGIALKNVDARLKAYFGAISGLYVDSELGKGTTVYLSLYDALVKRDEDEQKQ